MERYYLKVEGMAGPVVAHETLADAYAEARRLHKINLAKRRVYVLQVIGTIEPTEQRELTAQNG